MDSKLVYSVYVRVPQARKGGCRVEAEGVKECFMLPR